MRTLAVNYNIDEDKHGKLPALVNSACGVPAGAAVQRHRQRRRQQRQQQQQRQPCPLVHPCRAWALVSVWLARSGSQRASSQSAMRQLMNLVGSGGMQEVARQEELGFGAPYQLMMLHDILVCMRQTMPAGAANGPAASGEQRQQQRHGWAGRTLHWLLPAMGGASADSQLPDDLLRQAADVALHHSRQRTGRIPPALTLRCGLLDFPLAVAELACTAAEVLQDQSDSAAAGPLGREAAAAAAPAGAPPVCMGSSGAGAGAGGTPEAAGSSTQGAGATDDRSSSSVDTGTGTSASGTATTGNGGGSSAAAAQLSAAVKRCRAAAAQLQQVVGVLLQPLQHQAQARQQQQQAHDKALPMLRLLQQLLRRLAETPAVQAAVARAEVVYGWEAALAQMPPGAHAGCYNPNCTSLTSNAAASGSEGGRNPAASNATGSGGAPITPLDADMEHMRCARCRCAQYCSAECQRAAWPQHKRVCAHLKRIREQRKAARQQQQQQG